ncbi:MAG: M48 family metalloprotease [Vulcanimicrobiaceae bacterium]
MTLRKTLPTLILMAMFLASPLQALALTQQEQWELSVGQKEYNTLQSQGKIVLQSPYYAILNPIAKRIASVADRQYFRPFHFILVNDSQPNAFSVPGGNVYVTTSMMTFAQNQQELAGVLCHETAHDIHHDVYNNARKDQNLAIGATILSILLARNSQMGQNIIGLGANLQALNYSRAVETNADHTGAFICAQAGENPWGMIWLFRRFESKPSGVPLEMLSDHPRDDHRVTDLITLFQNNPGTFGRYSSNVATATPLRR